MKNQFEELEKKWAGMTVTQLAGEIRALRDELDDAAKVKTGIQKIYDFLTISIVPERMDDEGIETMKVEGVGRLQASSDIRCSCLAKNREALYIWLETNGHEAMVSNTVNSSSLKAFVKAQMKDGGDYPVDLLNVEPYSRATVVKG